MYFKGAFGNLLTTLLTALKWVAMNERTGQILEAAVQEFIETGEPVSSGWLYSQYDFGIKPAMIRLELDGLEEGGYLQQPYHSAGRIPTDTGYEFYAARALAADLNREMRSAFAKLLARRAYNDLLQELSSELGLLSVVVDSMNDQVHKVGLEALVSHLNWENRDEIRSVIRDFETVDERLLSQVARLTQATQKEKDKAPEGPQVFIGKKSPVTQSENLSVISGTYQVGDTTVSIFAIGPKRMDYKKTIHIFRNLWVIF